MSPPGSGPIEIFVFKGGRFLGSRCFSQPTVIIGRGREAALKLQDPQVSERHALLRLEGRDLILADNSSQGGVFVNGERITAMRLTSLDEVAIGPFRIKISVLGAPEEAEDPGFGESEHTVPRHRSAARDEATVPRITAPTADPDFEEMETRAGYPHPGKQRVTFSAVERLPAAAPAEPAYEDFQERPTRPEIQQPQPAPLPAARAERALPPAGGRVKARDKARARREMERELERLQDAGDTAPEDAIADPGHPMSTIRTFAVEESTADQPLPAGEMVAFEEDDEEDEEATWVEPFSLLENIVRERFKTPIATAPHAMVEVIQYVGSEIVDLHRADPGQNIAVGLEQLHLVSLDPDGQALLYFQKDFSGTLVARGKARPLKHFFNPKYLVEGTDGTFAVVLQEGDYAQVLRKNTGYLIRFVKPPLLPTPKLSMAFGMAQVQSGFASVALHFLILILFGVLNPETALHVEDDTERFARVALKDLNLEQAVEEPKIEAKKDEPVPVTKDQPKEPPPKVQKKAPRERERSRPIVKSNVPVTTKQQQRVQRKQVANVLSALENLKPVGAAPGRSDLKALASNISAVRVPGGGSAANFRVSGVIGKGVGDGVRLASGIGGGGGKDTRVGTQLLAGGSVGKLSAIAGTGTRAPRGRVGKAPARSISTSGGTLSREAIQQVVSAHMHEVQACYERQLIANPGLAGKIVFDWVIEMGGGVSSARQAASTVRNPAVSMCVLGLIRTWRFPSPVGGSVQVRYPFVFRVQGF